MIAWDHWHIEPSSICALQCPRCPRTEVPGNVLDRQLDLKFFTDQIGTQAVRHMRRVTFCGNDGDPIYCRDLVPICQWLKSTNPALQIVIVTNGSNRTTRWWQQLGSVLDTRDQVHWSLDGWDQSSNIQYRVNSRWDSIMAGYQAFSAINQTTYKIWATIAFRFNQDHLENIRNMAQDLGFDCWQLTKSTKFNSHYPLVYGQNDALCPTVDSLVSRSHRFEREYQTLSPKLKFDPLRDLFQQRAAKLQQIGKYSSLCMIGTKGVFVNSRGELYPCCWTANRYPHNQSWHDRAQSQFNLYQRSWSDIANDEFWTKDFLEFDAQECQTKCTKEKLQDQTHVTEW